MLDERTRLRLQELNRKALPSLTPAVSRARKKRQPATAPLLKLKKVPQIAGLVRQADVVANAVGEHLRIRLPVDELWPGGERLVARRIEYLAGSKAAQLDSELSTMAKAFPDEVLFLDLETCGFAGSPLFLVGVLRNIDDRLTVELYLARSYAEESAVLASFWLIARETTVLVSFNGKSFDEPMLLDRTTRHLLFRQFQQPQWHHIDLLHHSRRRWQQGLPDCRLQTLEQQICGRERVGDIAGGQIPRAYQDFVQTGLEREIDSILMHNAIDLVTLLDLAMRLAA